ncbi:hypothetical protein LSAT2_019094 [Lamellibrachia satsuma]|nr:hypothetical protein LSAT2_019094 [Lamellibrachia satsuma]
MYTLTTCVFPLQFLSLLLVTISVAKAALPGDNLESEKTIRVSSAAGISEGQKLQDEMENELNEIDDKFRQTPALNDDELFKDMFPLTSDNFTRKVLKRKDAWIAVIHDGKTSRSWMNMARALRGIVWVGMIDQTTDMELINKINVTSIGTPNAVVFPYGSAEWKQNKAEAVTTPMEAKAKAVATLPDLTQKLSASTLNDFLMTCYMPSPSKFPAILLTSESQVPPLIKALAIHFDEYFHFGVMSNPSSDDLKALGLTSHYLDLPVFLVLINTEMTVAQKTPGTSAAVFDTNAMGEMNYPNMLKFLFATNNMYRHLLLGDNQANKESVATMKDVLVRQEERFDIKVMTDDLQKREEL